MIQKAKTAGSAIEENATLDTGVEFHSGAITAILVEPFQDLSQDDVCV